MSKIILGAALAALTMVGVARPMQAGLMTAGDDDPARPIDVRGDAAPDAALWRHDECRRALKDCTRHLIVAQAAPQTAPQAAPSTQQPTQAPPQPDHAVGKDDREETFVKAIKHLDKVLRFGLKLWGHDTEEAKAD